MKVDTHIQEEPAMLALIQHPGEESTKTVRFAPCRRCGSDHPVKNRQELCVHCQTYYLRARKKALPWLAPC
jgi:ribosomal protein L40E